LRRRLATAMGELNADCGILSPHKGKVRAFGNVINTNDIKSFNEGSPLRVEG
jgi:hypothetical protein